MDFVAGIVLHQTSSNYTAKTLAEYAFRPSGEGTHFLINPAGQIFQTARINQKCWHIGRIQSYCQQLHRCAVDDQAMLERIAREYQGNKTERDRRIDAWEQRKKSADRYPKNADALGIEVVGAPVRGVYVRATEAQNNASKFLVRELLSTLRLDRGRVFPHGMIDPRKEESEGRTIEY